VTEQANYSDVVKKRLNVSVQQRDRDKISHEIRRAINTKRSKSQRFVRYANGGSKRKPMDDGGSFSASWRGRSPSAPENKQLINKMDQRRETKEDIKTSRQKIKETETHRHRRDDAYFLEIVGASHRGGSKERF
jgi:hypothetical protein